MPYDSEITTKSRDLIVLEKARERIARGWCQNAAWSGSAVCMGAALIDAGDDLLQLKRLLGFPFTHDLTMWNDAPGRTQAEVLARFDEAIARLAEQA